MQPPAYFRRTYDEALTLMIEARNYMAYVEPPEHLHAGFKGLRMSCEAMRVTSRLTQVMAWLMMQRAVHEGEVDVTHALSEHNRLSGADVCLDESFRDDDCLPNGLRSLLDRSLSLYQRIARLEQQMITRLN